MGKILTNEDVENIKYDLLSTKSSKRRSAAKKIGKYLILNLGDNLFEAYQKEKLDIRTWETQVEMLTSLGKIGYKPILKELNRIIEEHKINYPTIITSASLAYVRIMRNDINDATPILDLLEYREKAILNGATKALAFDDMIPSNEQINKILKKIEGMEVELNKSYIKGTFDPREYILSAISHWDRSNIDIVSFIQMCSKNEFLSSIPGLIDKVQKGEKIYSE